MSTASAAIRRAFSDNSGPMSLFLMTGFAIFYYTYALVTFLNFGDDLECLTNRVAGHPSALYIF